MSDKENTSSKQNFEEFQVFLDKVSIPKIKKKPKTFLGIAKQPHYENVLSNIYAFYFDINEEHGFKDLFISSFQELINETVLGKERKINLASGFDVFTEYSTEKSGRIDLLLQNTEQAIIIENKVNHHAKDNDLDDYWKTIDLPEKQKIGVFLSLNIVPKSEYSQRKKAHQFINIKHLDLLERVMKNSGNYLLEANDKYILFLKDLYQNTKNLSKSNMKKEDLKFYFDNTEKINDLQVFHRSVYDFIKRQVMEVKQILGDGFTLEVEGSKNEERLRHYAWKDDKNLMITVLFEEVMTTKPRLFIAVEMKHDLLDNKEEYRPIFSEDEKEKLHLNEDFYTKNGHWAHFASEWYEKLDTDNVMELSAFILKHLKEEHFLYVYNKLKTYISNKNKALSQT